MNINILDTFGNKVALGVIGKPYLFKLPEYQGEYKKFSDRSIEQASQNIGKKMIIGNQYHSSEVSLLDEHNRDEAPVCDALITRLNDVAIFVLASDCVPILLYDEQGGCIGTIHAGRKGLENNIIRKTLKKFSGDTSQIQIFIGPCISGKNYELGYNEIKCFQGEYNEQIESSKKNSDKYYLDIRNIAYKQLLKFGIDEGNIAVSSECTYENIEKYHSYRRHTHKEEEHYGNNAFGIWLN